MGRADARVLAALKQFQQAGKITAAICAVPLVLQKAGVIDGKNMTCYPSTAPQIPKAKRLKDQVVKAGNIIVRQGRG